VVPLAVGLAVLGRGGPWRLLVGAWYTVWISLKTALLLRALWRWLPDAASARTAVVAVFLAGLAPYVGLGGHVVTSPVHLTNNLARQDYLSFYWGELEVDLRSVRLGLEGGLHARLYQTFQDILLRPGLRDGRPRGGRAHHERPCRGGDGTRLLALPGHRGDQSGRPSWHGWERR
jgi:hypothetical protein